MNAGYYVSVVQGSRRALLAGPFSAHGDAISRVDDVKRVACSIDPWLDFAAFGTARAESEQELPQGKLNSYIAL